MWIILVSNYVWITWIEWKSVYLNMGQRLDVMDLTYKIFTKERGCQLTMVVKWWN